MFDPDKDEETCSSRATQFFSTDGLKNIFKDVFLENANKKESGSHLSIAKINRALRYQTLLTEQEIDHVWSCGHCRDSWEMFQVATRNATDPLPSGLRSKLLVDDSPILFPDGTISLESCQFGRLEQLRIEKPNEYFDIINIMAKRLVQYTRLNVSNNSTETIVLAAFGNVVKAIADHASGLMATLGFKQVEAISVTDFEHPKFECERATFVGAKCVCLCDVSHQGRLLKKMASEAQIVFSSKEWIHQLAIIKQIDESDTGFTDHQGLWIEKREQRYSYNDFITKFNARSKDLCLFEPELSRSEIKQQNIVDTRSSSSKLMTSYFLERDAVSINKLLNDNRYLFFLDGYQILPSRTLQPSLPNLRLANPIERVENYFYKKTAQMLKNVIGENIHSLCIAFHERRNSCAGKIAERFSDILYQIYGVAVPTVAVGWAKGCLQTVTRQQVSMLSKSRSVLMVDGAFRTGDAMQSLYRSIAEVVGSRATIQGLTVVGSQSKVVIFPYGAEQEVHIHSILQFPLLPPIPRLSDCTKRVKESAKKIVSEMPEQGNLSRIRDLLLLYIDRSEDRVPDLAVELTKKLVNTTFKNRQLLDIRQSLLEYLDLVPEDELNFVEKFAGKLIHEFYKHGPSLRISAIEDSLLSSFEALEEEEPEFAFELAGNIANKIPESCQFAQLREVLFIYLEKTNPNERNSVEYGSFEEGLFSSETIRTTKHKTFTVLGHAENRKLDKVLFQLKARPEVIKWLKSAPSQKKLKSAYKAHSVLILAALGEFNWLGDSTWVTASQKWFTSAKLEGRWWAFPIVFLLLTERCLSHSYSEFNSEFGIKHLLSARNQLLRINHTSKSFHSSHQLTFDGFEQPKDFYHVPMIMIEVINYCLDLLEPKHLSNALAQVDHFDFNEASVSKRAY
ncbi:hypothetical protein Pan153_23970 [Gimesia panareensis]|uniref:Uncharacterized protein n=1 Tax=Gimesia panareensis TaxID=2527978 RepID=A0A518FN12_9PLAN|nr:hypothetical protein [Gimesia panareensis]QDV17742.1 hypothetical protein Pan153_23970 [Gimesia panareensis]